MSLTRIRGVEQKNHHVQKSPAHKRIIRNSQRRGTTLNNVTSHRRDFLRTQHYWTNGHEHLGETKNIGSKQPPFVFPSCSQILAYLQLWKARKKIRIYDHGKESPKDNYKASRFRDVLRKLRVDVQIEAEEAMEHKVPNKIATMTDVNPQYFTELSGRPVKEKFSLEQYIKDTREILKIRLLIGQEKDECIRMDQQFEEELHRLRKIQRCNRRFASGFEEFLSKDHEKSMRILEKAEQEIKLTENIGVRRNELSKRFGQIRLDIYFWEENWRMVKMCQMFLYRISPIAWRVQHDWIHRSESGKSVISGNSTDFFSRYKSPEEGASLEDLIELFERDIADAGPAELYFENPFDLIRIFRSMETQNLNALMQLESLAVPMADMVTTIKVTEAQIKSEISEIVSTIDDLQNSITEVESRATKLEEYANYLLRGVFRDLVCSEEVLYLRVFVEHTYESCVGPNDANLDSFSMMKWIERVHEELNLQLDNLPHEVVRACEREGFREETKAIREAEDAAKKFELMHRLLDALKRIMEPPITKKRPLMRRSAPVLSRAKPLSAPLQPTDEEIQYLTFFTDYCKQDDFITYRTKFPDDFDLSFESKRGDIEINEATTSEVRTNDIPLNGEEE